MKISDILIKDHVIASLEAAEKRDVLEEMSSLLSSMVVGLKTEELLEALLEREMLGSTGIGHGVAIPHAKIKGIDRVIVGFARSKKGVDFQSLDNKPVHLFFLIVAPVNSTKMHLNVLSSISRLLQESSVRKKLLSASGRDELFAVIEEEDNRVARGAVL